MKKIIISIIALIGIATYSQAQSFIVYGTDGTKTEYETSKVEKIEFLEADPHEYVDLGLPSGIKWAKTNIGATKPEEIGDYYAWGEIETKRYFKMENYKFFKEETIQETDSEGYTTTKVIEGITKYTLGKEGYKGYIDYYTQLENEDDAAFVNWGKNWRIPTKEQWQELIDNCTFTNVSLNGTEGIKVTGPNGKSIFLPGKHYDSWGESDFYWTSNHINTGQAWVEAGGKIVFEGFGVLANAGYRAYGRLIRPVFIR